MSGSRNAGEANGRCKLTDAQCLQLLADREAGAKYPELMARYGLSTFGVWRVIHHRAPRLRPSGDSALLRGWRTR